MKIDFARISEATRLVRSGQLRAATAMIQAALRGHDPAGVSPAAPPETSNDVVDVVDVVEVMDVDVIDVPARVVSPAPEAAERFVPGSFADGHDQRDYKLFIPSQAGDRPLPLVVMLHGCTQDPDDFAAGTGMNEAADLRGFYVLYPAQSRRANPQGCWNWFKHSHQQRERGEPALLAGMTRDVMMRHGVDPRRVYVAGLSAGGAMAAILGDTHPDLYAAVGVHSGLATGSALDLPSALSAMRGIGKSPAASPSGVPTIVFHGDADATVHLRNGEHIIAACVDGTATVEVTAVEGAGLRDATRAIYRTADGQIIAERWTVHGAPHAWSGGRAQGSYTDGRGPDASAEMLRFFFEHPHAMGPREAPAASRWRA